MVRLYHIFHKVLDQILPLILLILLLQLQEVFLFDVFVYRSEHRQVIQIRIGQCLAHVRVRRVARVGRKAVFEQVANRAPGRRRDIGGHAFGVGLQPDFFHGELF